MTPRDTARAIDALRRGWPVRVGGLTVLSIEAADSAQVAAFDPDGAAPILLADARAATLGLGNARDAAGHDAVLIARDEWVAPETLADPARDLATPMKGPFRALPPPADGPAALVLARHAGLLPAFLVNNGALAEAATDAAAIAAWADPARLRIVTRARLPVAGAEDATIVAFRSSDATPEQVALVIGKPDATPPLVRLHSECLTGDVFGSLKCDCGPQLQAAIAAIRGAAWGVLLYLRQEGRGIGLANKLRAYALQDQGFDTVDANLRLGLGVDSRDFGVAAAMLRQLGVSTLTLLTNNPAKVAALTAQGLTVTRAPHSLPANPHNAAYLATKAARTGHIL